MAVKINLTFQSKLFNKCAHFACCAKNWVQLAQSVLKRCNVGCGGLFLAQKLHSLPLWCLCICAAGFFAAVIFQSCGGLNTEKVKPRSQGTHWYTEAVCGIINRTCNLWYFDIFDTFTHHENTVLLFRISWFKSVLFFSIMYYNGVLLTATRTSFIK